MPSFAGLVHRPSGWFKKSPCLTRRISSDDLKRNRTSLPGGNTVLVEITDGVAWVTMNRPEKRNSINPTLSFEMLEVFEALDSGERCGALVLTGAGEA
jgi:hypothetical protein